MPLNFPAFDQCPKEFALIGKMLAAYGDMEFDLMNCVSMVINTDMAIKAMFRPRGESARVDIADALAREAYKKVGLETPYCEAIGNFRFCLRVRNQYAHCNWFWRSDIGLGFVDMQELAIGTKHLSMQNLTIYPLDLPLLEAQEGYFGYVQECLRYLANAYGRKTMHCSSLSFQSQQEFGNRFSICLKSNRPARLRDGTLASERGLGDRK